MKHTLKVIFFLAATALLIAPSGGWAADGDAQTEALAEEAPAQQIQSLDEPEQAASLTSKADSELIDVNFPNDEVRNIIRSVADMYELNVVIPDTLVGNVSIKLNKVGWKQIFKVVLEPRGFTYVEEDNIIRILSIQERMAEPMETHVFLVNFAKAAELRPAVLPLVNEQMGGRVQVDVRTNSLIVTERPAQLAQVEGIVTRLDRPTEQVMIESKFIEVTDNQMEKLGIDWSSLEKFGGNYAYTSNRTSTYDNNADDVRPALLDDVTKVDTAVLSMDSFSMVLNALKSDTKVELVSNPTIVTMNNTPAMIHIGEEYPIPNYAYNEETGTFEVNGFNYKPIGISLAVVPQVNNTGLINLQVQPEISSMEDTVTFGGASGAEIPIITQRRTSSTVTIKSGYTLAIGGLMESSKNNGQTRVPILGDIPLLGRLFRTDADTEEKRNLVIFITAKILNAEGSTYRDVISQKSLVEMGITASDIPGYAPSAEEEDLYQRLQKAREQAERADAAARARLMLDQVERMKNGQ